jgi:hypothetical protein
MPRYLFVVAALLSAGAAHAAVRCEIRPAIGGGTLTTCHERGSGAFFRPQQFRTRPAIGGGTGRTCTRRPAVGGGSITVCR